MKIAIFSDNFYPELSGISDSIISLAKELAELGHRINFYVPKYSAKNYQALNLANQEELDLGKEIKIKRLFSTSAPFISNYSRIVIPVISPNFFKDFKPDIIHTQLFFGVGLKALAAAKLNKLPIIGTNHTAISEFIKLVPFRPNFLKKASLDYAVWYYNRCDFVTAPSQSVFKEMLVYDFNKPHKVISNPIDIDTFCPSGEKLKYKKKFNLSDNTIIYAGRLSLEKNIEVLIRAVALAKEKINDINLAIAGSGQLEDELKRLARELGVEKEVKFFGTLSKIDLAKLYQAAEVFSIASTSETQSLTLMQAMACGLPAVAVDARALPEYVNEKNGFVVKAGDEKSMAEKFILLLENNELREKLSRGAAEYVRQFSAPNIAKEWEKLYSETIKNYKK
ncbi:MAG: glycosyltransferase [Patescibacteria group bacterium]|jgi:glycosyltransferase involved in cell wall biosynthesis